MAANYFELYRDVFGLFFVAILWGITNPLIKIGSKGVESKKSTSFLAQLVLDIKFLFSSWKFLLPFLLNQGGSFLYYITVTKADISLAVPLVNSLTFIFTILAGHMVGERINNGVVIGVLLVSVGVTLCVLAKV